MTPESHPKPQGGMFQGASPQLTFIFGIITGFALAMVISLIIFLPRLSGTAKTATTTTTNTNSTADAGTDVLGDVKKVSSDDYVRGDKNAKLTLIEYSDLECPFCKTFHPTMQRVMQEYDGKVRWVFRHFPLSFHANAEKEGEGALCAGKLGGNDKFWAFVDKVYERTTSNGTGFALTSMGPLAKEIGVDQTKFQACVDSGEMANKITDETNDGTQGGAGGTPTTFIVDKDGKTLGGFPGALPYDQVKAQLDSLL